MEYIINLQNFKREVKGTMDHQQIADMVLGFRFVDKLGADEEPEGGRKKLLPRDPKSYFAYL